MATRLFIVSALSRRSKDQINRNRSLAQVMFGKARRAVQCRHKAFWVSVRAPVRSCVLGLPGELVTRRTDVCVEAVAQLASVLLSESETDTEAVEVLAVQIADAPGAPLLERHWLMRVTLARFRATRRVFQRARFSSSSGQLMSLRRCRERTSLATRQCSSAL